MYWLYGKNYDSPLRYLSWKNETQQHDPHYYCMTRSSRVQSFRFTREFHYTLYFRIYSAIAGTIVVLDLLPIHIMSFFSFIPSSACESVHRNHTHSIENDLPRPCRRWCPDHDNNKIQRSLFSSRRWFVWCCLSFNIAKLYLHWHTSIFSLLFDMHFGGTRCRMIVLLLFVVVVVVVTLLLLLL